MNSLQVTVDGSEGRHVPVVVRAVGDIDLATAPALEAAIAEGIKAASETTNRRLIIDLGGITFCGSVGATALVNGQDDADARDVKLCVVAVGVMRRLLQLTKIDALLDVHNTMEDARDCLS